MNPSFSADHYIQLFRSKFPFIPTHSQENAFERLASFLSDNQSDRIFVLRGYAGTGKTTLINTLNKVLSEMEMKTIQLAPTGRAAKVISQYTLRPAYTIHKKIFFPKSVRGKGIQFTLAPNKHTRTLFIVDEVSMLSDDHGERASSSSDSLLESLLKYVYSGKSCSLLLIGDTAQLPPVQSEESVALNDDYIGMRAMKEVYSATLTDVVRQEQDSGVLFNATHLRSQLGQTYFNNLKLELDRFDDVIRPLSGADMLEALEDAYREVGISDTTIIVRSNKRANLYNQNIRSRVLLLDESLSPGDQLMVVKNNYFWIDSSSSASFIANGDLIEVLRIYKFYERYDFQFAKVEVKMVDYPDMPSFDTVLLLDTLTSDSPSLTYDESNTLYQKVSEDFTHLRSQYKRYMGVKTNPEFNALQVKFSYAMTCHKAQGGQWSRVFVEQPYAPDGFDEGHLRWLYTAFTRATEKLFLIGFENRYFEE